MAAEGERCKDTSIEAGENREPFPVFWDFVGCYGPFRDDHKATQPTENSRFILVSAKIAKPAVSPSQAGRRRFDPGRPLFV